MSSEKHDRLAKILETKYELEICGENDKARILANLQTLLDQAIGTRNVSRYELMEALRHKMADYRKERRKQDRRWPSI
jgi:hypothetical protein